MKKILETLNRKWAEYLLEILVITIGILGAFALNNWNEERKTRASEFKALLDLKEEFHANEASFQRILKYKASTKNKWKDFFNIINNHELPESKRAIMRPIAAIAEYTPVNSKLSSLLSSGKIENIRNDSLQNLLLSWPNVLLRYNMFEDMQVNFVLDHLAPLELELVPYTRRETLGYLTTEIRLNSYPDKLLLAAVKNMEYHNALINNYHLLSKQIESAEIVNQNFNLILELLDEEIKNWQ
jgi:hypothetical protein